MKSYWNKFFLKILLTIFVIAELDFCLADEVYLDINSFLRYDGSRSLLQGAENALAFRFRFCNDKGILLYAAGSEDDSQDFFALGINNGRVYLEWHTDNSFIELYIGDGNLQSNVTYVVSINDLRSRPLTTAFINGVQAPVNYLVTVDSSLSMDSFSGDLFIGGYRDVSDLKVNTERLTAYLVVCLDYIQTPSGIVPLDNPDESVGVNSCPLDFCAAPTVITMTSTSSFISMDIPLPPRTRTVISFRFRTKSSQGLLFYLGGPAYLTVFMSAGRLTLGLNTRGSGIGVFNSTSTTYNDGEWHYVRVFRKGNVASMEDDGGAALQVVYAIGAQSLNAAALFIGGTSNPSILGNDLPQASRVSLLGCLEAPRFISYSITTEPPPLLNFDTQVDAERGTIHGGCYSSMVCQPACQTPSQVCDFSCICASGFFQLSSSPLLCQNIDDCEPNPCLNGGTCNDLINDFECTCPLAYNKGKTCSIPNPCFPNPCSNGATCVDVNNAATCVCPIGFTGSLCSINIDECADNPCLNGGTCVDLVGSFACFCASGWTGSTCAVDIDECLSNPCLNGATCNNFINAYTCSCVDGWTGITLSLGALVYCTVLVFILSSSKLYSFSFASD